MSRKRWLCVLKEPAQVFVLHVELAIIAFVGTSYFMLLSIVQAVRATHEVLSNTAEYDLEAKTANQNRCWGTMSFGSDLT